MIVLDGDIVARARKSLDLSVRALGRQTNIGQTLLAHLEKTGQVHPSMTLGDLNALAIALGLPIEDLHPAEPEAVVVEPTEPARHEIVRYVVALLLTQPTLTSVDDLSVATGHSREDIQDAITVATPLLQQVGINLHRLKDTVGLRPAKDVTSEQAALEQQRHATRGLDQRTAKLLHLALAKPLIYGRLPEHQKPAAKTLQRLGILVTGDTPDSLVLSDDARFSLTGS